MKTTMFSQSALSTSPLFNCNEKNVEGYFIPSIEETFPEDSVEVNRELALKDRFEFTFQANTQVFQNFRGGKKQGTSAFGKFNVGLSVNLKSFGIKRGGKVFVHAFSIYGDTPTSALVGDFQPISRDETSNRTGLFELWYQQNIGNTRFTVGQHDMNSAFGTSRVGGNSMHSAFGVFPSISPNLGYAFSIYPRTMPGIYINHQLNMFSLKAAVYAGASTNFNADKHNLRWNLNDSGFFISEITYQHRTPKIKTGDYKLGVFKHTGEFPNIQLSENNVSISSDFGIYSIVDQIVSQDHSISVFAEFTYFPGKHNFSKTFYATGFEIDGLFASRSADTFFLGVLNTTLSSAALTQPNLDVKNRTVIEANYNYVISEHIVIKPDLQLIINPGANSQLQNALLGAVKIHVTL